MGSVEKFLVEHKSVIEALGAITVVLGGGAAFIKAFFGGVAGLVRFIRRHCPAKPGRNGLGPILIPLPGGSPEPPPMPANLNRHPLPPPGRTRRAFLVGKDPKTRVVNFLVKTNSEGGRSIKIYDLVTGGVVDYQNPVSAEWINYYAQIGYEIPHPQISHELSDRWVVHGIAEAKRLDLEVVGQPQPDDR